MAKNFIELVVGSLDEKKRWKKYKARVKQLPDNYRATVDAIERYLMYSGDGLGERMVEMYEDLAELFERAAIDETPVRDIVGDDPAEFVKTFGQSYSDGGWIAKERRRLESAIDTATGEEKDA